jgi:NADH dehydrogenase/NADH:ubiquinone oxidoreductase subunit G
LVEARSMVKIIERKLNTQHEVAFGLSKKTTNYSASGDYNTTKYHHSEREKKKENNCRKCGKNWTPGHRCEDMSLRYYRIVDGKQVEVSNPENEITIAYNSDSDYDETLPKVSLASISCTLLNRMKMMCLKRKLLLKRTKYKN